MNSFGILNLRLFYFFFQIMFLREKGSGRALRVK